MISIAIAFALGLLAVFSFDFGVELTVGAKILFGLALWTGSTVWYDAWEVIKALETKLKE